MLITAEQVIAMKPCRAIALAVVAARLTQMIDAAAKVDLTKMTEGDGE